MNDPLIAVQLREVAGRTNVLANPRIRVKNRERARIHIGDKVPVITTTAGATGFVSESVNYLDVGLKLEVEPQVFLEDDVGIRVGLEVSNISQEVTSASGTVAYQVGTRNASTVLRLRDGETQVLAGLINDEDRRSATQVPGLVAPAAHRAPLPEPQRHREQDRDRAPHHPARGAQHRAPGRGGGELQLGKRDGSGRRRRQRRCRRARRRRPMPRRRAQPAPAPQPQAGPAGGGSVAFAIAADAAVAAPEELDKRCRVRLAQHVGTAAAVRPEVILAGSRERAPAHGADSGIAAIAGSDGIR